jgi:tetratricopeptide (TPR) repeat protein
MGYQQSVFNKCRVSLILLVPLALSTVSLAETYQFQLIFFDGSPGSDQYRAGELDAAIEILESREEMADNQYVGKELATLCGFYVLKGNLDAARKTCSAAIEIDPSGFAYNNRAVLRVQLGDAVGALEDFDRVRVLPDDQPRYIEQLKKDDERLIASRNFALATELIERRRTNKPKMAGAMISAKVEDISH